MAAEGRAGHRRAAPPSRWRGPPLPVPEASLRATALRRVLLPCGRTRRWLTVWHRSSPSPRVLARPARPSGGNSKFSRGFSLCSGMCPTEPPHEAGADSPWEHCLSWGFNPPTPVIRGREVGVPLGLCCWLWPVRTASDNVPRSGSVPSALVAAAAATGQGSSPRPPPPDSHLRKAE